MAARPDQAGAKQGEILDIQISDAVDADSLATILQKDRRIQIRDFLHRDSAEALLKAIQSNQTWYLAYNENGRGVEIPLAEVQASPPQVRQQLFAQINATAANQFQYCFLQYAISDEINRGANPGHGLHAVHDFYNSEVWLDFMRKMTGVEEITHGDTLCSNYSAGHFLTVHDDKHERRDRVAAYVLSLTQDWQPDWGGHLAFLDDDGNIEQAFMPAFNTLNIFLVPQNHSVQQVATFAKGSRLSLTGWVYR